MTLRRLVALIATAVLIASCSVAAQTGSSIESQTIDSPSPTAEATRLESSGTSTSRDLIDVGSSGANGAWALTGHGLEVTNDAGLTWTDVTPPGGSPAGIKAIAFAGSSGSILTINSDGTTLGLLQTTDDGKTWTTKSLPGSYVDGVGGVWIDQLNEQDIWVSVRIATSSAESIGVGLRTLDGGNTWKTINLPSAGPLFFVDESNGWSAGGTVGQSFYRTTDGGDSWVAVTLPAPSEAKDHSPSFVEPTLIGPDAVLPVSWNLPNSGPLVVAFYTSTDSGASWQLSGTVQAAPGGYTTPVAVLGSSRWLVETANGLVETTNAGQAFSQVDVSGLDPNSIARFLSVGDSLWAVQQNGSCDVTKTTCISATSLSISTNGGSTWLDASP